MSAGGELGGRCALITGGSAGIGLATARLFLREGASVVITGRDETRLARAVEELGEPGRVHGIPGDVASMSDAGRMVGGAIDRFGRLDIVFCNAGLPSRAPIDQLSEEEWDQVIGANLKGVYTVVHHAAAHMKARGSGVIITNGSEAGLVGEPELAAYCASKGGVVTLTKALALELIPFGIRVNCIAPGITRTALTEAEVDMAPDPAAQRRAFDAWAPVGRWATPEEQAEGVLFLAGDRSSFAVGSTLVLDGGFTAR